MKKFTLLFLLLLAGIYTQANTIVVTNTNNSGAGSLRDAFTLAANNDTIRFSPVLLTSGADTITLSTEIYTTKNLVIKGLYTETDTLYISGQNTNRIFALQGNSYFLDSLVLVNGRSANGAGIYMDASGANVSIHNSFISNCVATQKGGAISFFSGTLYITNCSIKNNTATQDGGGIYYQIGGFLEIDRSEINNNTSNRNGGALYMRGSSTSECNIYRSVLNNNTSAFDGAALYYEGRYITLDSVTANYNTASGGLRNGIVYFDMRFSLVRIESTFTGCSIGYNNGVGIAATVLPNNSTSCESVMTVSYCTVNHNTRGGIYANVTADNANSNNQLNIDHSTLVNNGNAVNGHAGGVFAFATGIGGGSYSYTSQVRVVNSTVANNETNFDGSGIYSAGKLAGTSQVFVRSSIVAFNTGGNGRNIFSFSNATNVQSQSYNIFSETTVPGSTANDYTGATPAQLNLGALAYNGGMAGTMMPLAGSVAINWGNPSDMGAAQNGPVQAGRRDAGAAEYLACIKQHAYTVAICQGDSVLFGANYRQTAGTYRDTIPVGSCDSVVTLTLIVKQPSTHSITQSGCGSVTINAQTYTASGTYTQHFTNAAGCDSTLTLHLTVKQPTAATVTHTSCGNYTLNGQTYTASGTYTQTLTNSAGCDSTLTLHLTVKQPTTATLTHTSCGSYTLNGQTYTASGTYTQTLTNSAGCDSTLTLHLTVKQPTTATVSHTGCGSYTLNGQTYTASGTYTQTFTNAVGCDSTITLHLTVKQPTSATVSHTSCGNYSLNGQTYTASGTYIQTLTNVAGCDSTLTLHLTVKQPTTAMLTQTACGSYTLNGQTYTASGTYTQTLTNAAGCDSTLTLHLTVKQPTTATLTQTACGSYTLNGQTYTASGTYTQTLTNAAGCDSTLTFHLTVKQPTTATLTQTACGSYTLNGQTYTASGTYTQTLTNSAGCDSTLTLHLTVSQPTSATLTQTACGGYTFNGQTLTASGTYTQTLTNTAGCDSTVTLHLTVKQPTAATLTQTACGNYTLNGQTYTASGTYTQLLTNAAGCDSTITLHLIVKQPTVSTLTQTACGSYTLNGQTYTASGTYTQTFTNAAGCDSTLTLNLTLSTVNTAVTQTGVQLTATAANADYLWINCADHSPIAGATAQTFTATVNGDYAVIITQNGCTDTSACQTVVHAGVNEQAPEPDWTLFPNPTSGRLYLTGLFPGDVLTVFNSVGKTVSVQRIQTSTAEMDLTGQAPGIYFIQNASGSFTTVRKIILY